MGIKGKFDMSQPAAGDFSSRAPVVEYFDPDTTLITTLKRAIIHEQYILLEPFEGGELLLAGNRGEYFNTISDEPRFFTSPASSMKLTILSGKDPRIPPVEKAGRSIDELMWKAAFYSSHGRLMHGCYPADVVELEHWPNLTRLPHTANAARIASLLSRQPSSIALAARKLKIAPEEIYQFYSAARCAGLARPINRTPHEPWLEPHRHQTLLSALWEKIASL